MDWLKNRRKKKASKQTDKQTNETKTTTDQYAEEKRWVFNFVLKEESEDEERKGVPEHTSNALKGSLPQGPPAHPRRHERCEYPRLSEESDEGADGGEKV